MKKIITNMFAAFVALYRGRNLLWQVLGLVIVAVLVTSGADWWYFAQLRNSAIFPIFALAGLLGFFIPVVQTVGLWIAGAVTKNALMTRAGWMSLCAGIIGWGMSSFYKFFTGRSHPPHDFIMGSLDNSKIFDFGFGNGGIFWGWPSSHTATAFAMMVALAVYYREQKWIGILAVAYAFYIGIGASMSFHWLSDVVFGIILGTMIGVIVGRRFRNNPAVR